MEENSSPHRALPAPKAHLKDINAGFEQWRVFVMILARIGPFTGQEHVMFNDIFHADKIFETYQ